MDANVCRSNTILTPSLSIVDDNIIILSSALPGQTQIRRVRLPRIADGEGNVSYEELVGLVVVFSVPETPSSDSGRFNVSLTYYDVDGKFTFVVVVVKGDLLPSPSRDFLPCSNTNQPLFHDIFLSL